MNIDWNKIDNEWEELKNDIEYMIDHHFGKFDIRSIVEECLDKSDLNEDDKKLLKSRSDKLTENLWE